MKWPEKFMWGTGASSTQCEGAAPASDWWDWERAGHAPISADGNGFSTRYTEDFDLLAELGLIHHRLSIEWARIEPEPGIHDQKVITHYRNVLEAAHKAGIVPWVCLHHFTLPRWFAESGGFLVERNRTELWRRHIEFVAETFGDLVRGWQPVNETNYYALLAYQGRGFPPGRNNGDEYAYVNEAIHLATAEAAVLLKQTGAPVSSIFGLSPIVAQDDEDITTDFIDRIQKRLWRPGIDLFHEGVLSVPGRRPVERPDLAHSFDIFGFSYYTTLGVRSGQWVIHPPNAPVSPLGYGVWADGLRLVLESLDADLPGVPILIAEYGVGTQDDGIRAQYLSRGLEITHQGITRGIEICGFFHWTAVDNYEWLHGYDVQFGIIDRGRNVRESAKLLQREAKHSTSMVV